jgi:hypothetical protein
LSPVKTGFPDQLPELLLFGFSAYLTLYPVVTLFDFP